MPVNWCCCRRLQKAPAPTSLNLKHKTEPLWELSDKSAALRCVFIYSSDTLLHPSLDPKQKNKKGECHIKKLQSRHKTFPISLSSTSDGEQTGSSLPTWTLPLETVSVTAWDRPAGAGRRMLKGSPNGILSSAACPREQIGAVHVSKHDPRHWRGNFSPPAKPACRGPSNMREGQNSSAISAIFKLVWEKRIFLN